jgi:ABC-type branched-subunit amino acid transport system substrate-binding protein
MNMLIDAIRTAGENKREKIQKSIAQIKYEGVTGTIQFDRSGNRTGDFIITELENGYPVVLNSINN